MKNIAVVLLLVAGNVTIYAQETKIINHSSGQSIYGSGECSAALTNR